MRTRIGPITVGLLVLCSPATAWAGDPAYESAVAQPLFDAVLPGTTVSAAAEPANVFGPAGDVLYVNVPPVGGDRTATDEANWRLKLAAALAGSRLPDTVRYVMSGAPLDAGRLNWSQPMARLDTVSIDAMRAQADSNAAVIAQQFGANLTAARVETVPVDPAANAAGFKLVFGVKSLGANPSAIGNAFVGADVGLVGGASALAEGVAVVVCDPAQCVSSFSAARAGWGSMRVTQDADAAGLKATAAFPNLTGGPPALQIVHAGLPTMPVVPARYSAATVEGRKLFGVACPTDAGCGAGANKSHPSVRCDAGRRLVLKLKVAPTSVKLSWASGATARAHAANHRRDWSFTVPAKAGGYFEAAVSYPKYHADFKALCR